MNMPIEFDLIQRRKALDDWLSDCKRRMELRFPEIDFDAELWPIKTLYRTEQPDFYFTEPLLDLEEKDRSYREALRCLVAEMVLAGKPKDMRVRVQSFRAIAHETSQSIFNLNLQQLRQVETHQMNIARETSSRTSFASCVISNLERFAHLFARKGVVPKLGYIRRAEIKTELRTILSAHEARFRSGKGDLLDRKIEAFNEAFNAMLDNPTKEDGIPVLLPEDRIAICTLGISLCAPSRINEIMTMSIDDYVTVDDYVQNPISTLSKIHQAHQMLIITQKGSKGAEWGPKPILLFMMDVFHYCIKTITELGSRSRMLIEWYQKYPNKLYLPPELEYLRGQNLCRSDMAKIIYLTPEEPPTAALNAGSKVITALKKKRFKALNPNRRLVNGRLNSQKFIVFVKWDDVEDLLLKQVHKEMSNCRRVTALNYYEGNLAKMLFLFDRNELPFLPQSISYQSLRRRLKRVSTGRDDYSSPPTIFEKLNIKIPVGGKIQYADIAYHDPRRWLSTNALKYGEKLSDVLINKWARRNNLAQLKAYDFRTQESMAAASSMPESEKLIELFDLSNGLAAVEKLEHQFGLQTAIVTAQDAGIAVTSMEAISNAIENRPVANSNRGVIIIYPQRFGACLHQHHEKPCRNYSNDLSASCITCNEGVHVKGHIPTNEATRDLSNKLFTIIIRHLENLALTHNRNVADDPTALGEHMLTLIEKGLNSIQLAQLANHLIDEFHQVKNLLKDRQLANRLEQAFVARGVVKRFDDSEVQGGALIKYHNPKRHSEPLMEIALDEHGGREQVLLDESSLIAQYPQLASNTSELKDERHLIVPDDNEKDNK